MRDAGAPIAFDVIGSDQALGTPATTDTLVFETVDTTISYSTFQALMKLTESLW